MLLVILVVVYRVALVLAPASVWAWGLGVRRSSAAPYLLPLFFGAYGLSFFLSKHGLSWSPEALGKELWEVLVGKGRTIVVLSCVSWLAVWAGCAVARGRGRRFRALLSRFAKWTVLAWTALVCTMSALAQHLSFGPSQFYAASPGLAPSTALIAHAGGAIDGHPYTNSREAVDQALRQGYRFVEVDLQQTSDGVYVGAHDWDHFASISDRGGIPTLAEFRTRTIYERYSVVTAEDLSALLNAHDTMWLVTDKATDYPALLRQIPFPRRMLVEVFSLRDLRRARAAGVVYPALNVGTLNAQRILSMALHGVDMVTVDIRDLLAQQELFEWLHQRGLTIVAYTIHDEALFCSLYGRCLDMAYVDEPFSSFFEDVTEKEMTFRRTGL